MSKINKSPVLTSQNYGINYFEFDDNLLIPESKCDFKAEFTGTESEKIKITEISNCDDLKNNLSQNIENFAKKHLNFAKNIEFYSNFSKPFVLDFKNFENSTFCDHIILHVNEGVNARIIIKNYLQKNCLQISTIKLVCESNSYVDCIIFNNSKNSNANLLSFEANQNKNSFLNLCVVEFSSQNSVQNLKVNLLEDTAKADIKTLYFGQEKNKLGLNYSINQFGKSCKSKIDAFGLLSGECEKNFVGTINFERGASKGTGEEKEFCYVLSNGVRAKSTPILLSKEDDAIGKHSSSVQNIDPKQMFYANSRGLSKKDATKIFINAKLNKFLQNIFDKQLKTEIIELIDGGFSHEII